MNDTREFESTFEKIHLKYAYENPQYLKSIMKGFYANPSIDAMAQLIRDFFEKTHDVPSHENIIAILNSPQYKVDGEIQPVELSAVFKINLDDYDKKWLEENVRSWIKWKNLDYGIRNVIEYVRSKKVDPDNVNTVIGAVTDIMNDSTGISFDSDVGFDFFDSNAYVERAVEYIKSPWNHVNQCADGYALGTLVCYMGEQNIGKSIWLANEAATHVMSGRNTLFISAEMGEHAIAKRIGANLFNTPMSEFKELNKQDIAEKIKRLELESIENIGKLQIKQVPTSTFTTLDLEAYLKNLKETTGMLPEIVIIDYINILSNYRNPNSENTYMKIKQLAEDLRAIAVKHNIVIVTATQINRTGWDANDLQMGSISESAGLAHTVDMLYGIIQDVLMRTTDRYILKILKIRDGEGRDHKINFDINWKHMRLTEGEVVRMNMDSNE